MRLDCSTRFLAQWDGIRPGRALGDGAPLAGRILIQMRGFDGKARVRGATLVVACLLATPTNATQESLTLEEVIARASTYVEVYVKELTTVVMEEDYRQSHFRRGRTNPTRTQLRSEFLLVRLGEDAAWTGFRDVFEANGRRVRDRQDRLASLFLDDTTTAVARARRVVEESSRYNLGTTSRTFNIPTYALSYLLPSNTGRFRFEQDGVGCGDDHPAAWDVRYEEVATPTLTRGFQNINLPSNGRFCIDPAAGTIFETEIELHHPSVGPRVPATEVVAVVTFALDPDVGLWVPSEMRERYSERRGGRTTSTARYGNYRKFSVTTSENTAPDAEPDDDGG